MAGTITLAPFYWEFVLATHTTADISNTPPPIWPGTAVVQNYRTLLDYAPYFWRIVLPLAAPASGALAITTFIGGWNSFLGPLTLMSDPSMYTYPVALANLKGVHGTDTGALLLGSAIATIPMLLITLFGSRRLIDGLTAGALSGQ